MVIIALLKGAQFSYFGRVVRRIGRMYCFHWHFQIQYGGCCGLSEGRKCSLFSFSSVYDTTFGALTSIKTFGNRWDVLSMKGFQIRNEKVGDLP